MKGLDQMIRNFLALCNTDSILSTAECEAAGRAPRTGRLGTDASPRPAERGAGEGNGDNAVLAEGAPAVRGNALYTYVCNTGNPGRVQTPVFMEIKH